MSEEGPKSTFIPAWLDDAGLSAPLFRVLCHISRSGQSTRSAATIAGLCRMKRDTVFRALSELERLGLIERKSQVGKPTLIAATPVSELLSAGLLREVNEDGKKRFLFVQPVPPNGTPTRPPKRDGYIGPVPPNGTGDVPPNGTPPVPPNGTGISDPSPELGLGMSPQTGHHPSPQTGHKGSPIKVPLKKDEEAAAAATPERRAQLLISAHPRRHGNRKDLEAALDCIERHAGRFDEILAGTTAYADALSLWTTDERISYTMGIANFFDSDEWASNPEKWVSRRGARTRLSRGKGTHPISDDEIAELLGGRKDNPEPESLSPAAIVHVHPKWRDGFGECIDIVKRDLEEGCDAEAMLAGIRDYVKSTDPLRLMSPGKFFREKHWRPAAEVRSPSSVSDEEVRRALGGRADNFATESIP